MLDSRPLSLSARWLIIAIATVALQVSYWLLVSAVTAASVGSGELTASGGALALAFGLTPFVFMVLVFGSRHPRAPGAVIRAMGLFLLIALPLGLFDVVIASVGGFAAGATVALRREPEHSLRWRWIAVGLAVLYVLVLLALAPALAVISGAILPFAVVGIADQAHEAREQTG